MHSFSRCTLSTLLDSSSAISDPSVLALWAAHEVGGGGVGVGGGMDGPLLVGVVVVETEVEVEVGVAILEVSSSSSSSSSSSAAEVPAAGSIPCMAIFFFS